MVQPGKHTADLDPLWMLSRFSGLFPFEFILHVRFNFIFVFNIDFNSLQGSLISSPHLGSSFVHVKKKIDSVIPLIRIGVCSGPAAAAVVVVVRVVVRPGSCTGCAATGGGSATVVDVVVDISS